MADLVKLTVDLKDVERLIRAGHREYTKATARAMNRAVGREVTQVARGISEVASIQPRRLVRRRIKQTRANPQRLLAGIRFLDHPIPAARLQGARDTGRGGWRARKGSGVVAGSRKWPAAFIAKGKGGTPQVFERKGKARTPIRFIGIDVKQLAAPYIYSRILIARKRFAEDLPGEIKFAMTGRR